MRSPIYFSSGDAGRGLHLAAKPKILTLVNGEDDVVSTGNGQIPLRHYAFRHFVMGQFKPVEEVLTDFAYGFPKRFHEVWCAAVQTDPTQQCTESIQFLKDGHDFMAQHAYPNQAEHYPDGFAADFNNGVANGIKDYLSENPDLSENYRQVLEYADTHLARMSNAVMRACQHCETLAGVAFSESDHPGQRVAWNVWEAAHALWNLFRLWEYQLNFAHSGQPWEEPGSRPRGGMLTCRRWKDCVATTRALRETLKYDLKKLGFETLTAAVVAAADELVKMGILREVKAVAGEGDEKGAEGDGAEGEPKPKRAKKQQGGWPMTVLRKLTWRELSEDARQGATGMHLGPDTFGA
jgi:hypothetical protein